MPELRHLALDDLPVGVRGAKVIAAGGTFANLTVLSLENCQLRETGTRTILESTALPNITELQLKNNNGGPALERLANPKCFPKLARCEISNNRLPTKLLSKLRKRPGVSF